MQYTQLGPDGPQVSRICLGTMTWGEQNTEAEAHAQMDLALDRGVNFLDAAEMYPIPPRAETQGRTETYIGNWMKARGTRDKVVLATKISGPGGPSPHIRQDNRFDRKNIVAAVDASLRRLQTDTIDLYQLHWPERTTNFFGQLGYRHRAGETFTPFAEILGLLGDLVTAGKIRYVGLSNESAWGLMKFLAEADRCGLPRPVTIQNPYSLLNRSFEVGLAEAAIRESCGLLAYSPLAFGTLSGKYLHGAKPEGARITRWPFYSRYTGKRAQAATAALVALARRHKLHPVQMALAFVTSRPFVTANIIGATSLEQLGINLGSIEVPLPDDLLKEIEAIHDANPYPAP